MEIFYCNMFITWNINGYFLKYIAESGGIILQYNEHVIPGGCAGQLIGIIYLHIHSQSRMCDVPYR